ncbi:MAG: oligopeptidase B [Calditrichia bacterium]
MRTFTQFWHILANILLIVFILNSCSQTPQPPVAKKIPKADTLFGDVRIDNYYWLRDRNNPEVIQYLEAENAYTAAVMKHTEPLQKKLFQEMKSRIKETDLSVPVKKGDYYYYTRTEAGKQYSIYCRKKGSMDAPEEILLDVNQLAEGHEFLDIGKFAVSPDHQMLAYSVDTTGSETFTVYFKNLMNDKTLPEKIDNVYYPLEWANDNRTLFYTTLDDTKRPYRLYRYTIGEKSELVYQEDDLAYYLDLSKTRSGKYILMSLGSQITSEVHFLDADRPRGKLRLIEPRDYGVEYSVDHHDGHFYIVTNYQARNFRVMRTSVKQPARKYWKEFLPYEPEVKIDGVDCFKNHLVIYERRNGLKSMRIYNFKKRDIHSIKFPEPVYTYWSGSNPDYNADFVRFAYMSLVTPRTIYDYNMNTRELKLQKRQEVLGGYDPSQYQMERIYATAPDGVKIPMSLVYRKGLKKDGQNPALLYGYGSYGATSEPYFSSNRISLLDRGFVFAIGHIRGGGEMGRQWYEDGKFLKKKNTFTDFIACAEKLIEDRYTSPKKLAISGGSAGGLLMGAVTNMRPDLFKVVVAHVPFVDVVNTMLDETLPLTVIEYDEWGNPHKEEFYFYMKSYAPYENVEARAYPNILVTAGLNDPRVGYWEPAKWVAKLRDMKTDNNRLLLKTKMVAGHMGASGRYDNLKDVAFEYAFILDCLGIKE